MNKRISRYAGAVLLASIGIIPAAANATYSSDLQINLGKDGNTITVFAGAEDDSFGDLVTTFDDESSNLFDDSAPFPSDMQPWLALSFFDGAPIAGTWSLGILDDFEPNEGDDLLSWSIFGTLVTGAPFEYFGPAAFDVDTDPRSFASFVVTDTGTIADINLRVEFGNASIPVPTTLALLGLGLAGIGYRRRKQLIAA